MKSTILLILALITFVSAKYSSCYSSGDPHYKMFNGKKIDSYFKGTLLMAKTEEFIVHSLTKTWNRRYSVNVATGIEIDGNKIVVEDKYNRYVKINGVNKRLENGKNQFANFVIDKHGSRIFVRSGKEFVSVQTNYRSSWKKSYGSAQYQNVVVFGDYTDEGICGNGKVVTASGIFDFVEKKEKVIASSHCTYKQKIHAEKLCKKRFKSNEGQYFQWCVFDTCAGLRAKWAASYAKQIKYWKSVVNRFNKYRQTNLKMAKEYYEKSLEHLEQMRVHGRKYREHVRKAEYYKKKYSENNSNYNKHKKQAANFKKSMKDHSEKSKYYLQKSKEYKRHAELWMKKVKDARMEVEKSKENIRNNEKVIKGALNKFKHYSKLATKAISDAAAHQRSADAHEKSSNWHIGEANKHLGETKKHEKEMKYHNKMVNHHLNMRNHHQRHHDEAIRNRIKQVNKAELWLSKIKNTNEKIKYLAHLYNSQFKKEVEVSKTVLIKSRKCPSTPKYLDSIKFSSTEKARERALDRCNHGKKFVRYSCVYDHSIGMFHTKFEYERLAQFEKEEAKIEMESRNRWLSAYSWGDPHNSNFDKKKYDVYNTKGWFEYYDSEKTDVEIKGFLSYSKAWGSRSINRFLQFNLGKHVTLFKPNGVVEFNTDGWKVSKNNRYIKEWKMNYKGSTKIRVVYQKNHGYYSFYLAVRQSGAIGCSGSFCGKSTSKRKKYRLEKGAKKRIGDEESVRFGSKCKRKITAFRVCAFDAKHLSGSKKIEFIKECVSKRKNL